MKIGGRTIPKPTPEVLVIPRPESYEQEIDTTGKPVLDSDGQPKMKTISNDIVFKMQAVLDYDEFDVLLPPPEPPMTQKRGEAAQKDMSDAKFLQASLARNQKKTAYMVIKSLEATEGLEWDSVKLNDPETWENWTKDLGNAGLNEFEQGKILRGVMDANGFGEEKYVEAKRRFLASQAAGK